MSTLALQHPRLIPMAVAALLGGTLLCASLARLTNYAAIPAPPAMVASAALTFADTAAGGVAVHNAATGALVATIPARDDGFLRMTLRLLGATRARQNIGGTAPFLLQEYAGGRMALRDPSTGQSIELEAFGPSNIAEFSRLLEAAS